jgi:hypothetical protein
MESIGEVVVIRAIHRSGAGPAEVALRITEASVTLSVTSAASASLR